MKSCLDDGNRLLQDSCCIMIPPFPSPGLHHELYEAETPPPAHCGPQQGPVAPPACFLSFLWLGCIQTQLRRGQRGSL